jgi:predicted ATPase
VRRFESCRGHFDGGELDTIPASLAGLLSLRLDSLGPGEQDVLRVASIAGVDVEIGVVEALLTAETRPFLDRHSRRLIGGG